MALKELKELLALPLSLHMAYDKAKADGKLDLNDLGYAFEPAKNILPAIDGVKNIPAEFKGATEEEMQELKVWAKATYDIADDKLEAAIEQGISLALEIELPASDAMGMHLTQ